MGGLLERLRHGGPEYNRRKEEAKQLEEEARKARLEGLRAGTIVGARKAGFKEGKEKAMRKGGITGFLERVSEGAKTMDKTAGALTGDVNFGGMGKGLEFDFGGGGRGGIGSGLEFDFGGNGTSRKKTRHKRSHKRRHSRKR